MEKESLKSSLRIETIKMNRKVSFRDEAEKNKPIADVHYIVLHRHDPIENRGKCINC